MPAKQEPNIGINYGWNAGESGINLQLDENWKAIGALLQLSVVSATDNIPTSPVAGDRYIIPTGATGVWSTHVGKVARYNEGTWEIYTPLKGWFAYTQDVETYLLFDGSDWGTVELGDANSVTYDNTASGLTASEVQSAIDELAAQPGGVTSVDGSTGAVDLSGSYEVKRKNNLVATTDPTVNDDTASDYEPLSRWVNITTGEFFVCVVATTGGANWQQASLTLDELGSAALVNTGTGGSEVPTNVDLGSAAFTASGDYATAAQGTKADNAVSAVDGKQLSDENFTSGEKSKLSDIRGVASYSMVEANNAFQSRLSANLVWDGVSDTYSREGVTTGVTPTHEAMRRCVMTDDGNIAYYLDPTDSTKKADGSLADITGADGQVMVEIPKFYVKISTLFNGYVKREISEFDRSGFVLHPAFCVGGTLQYDPTVDMWWYKGYTSEREATYIGAYQASVFDTSESLYIDGLNLDNNDSRVDTTTDTLASVSGKYPMIGLTRNQFRTVASNRGSGWSQWSFWQLQAVKLLFFIEYGSFDGQASLVQGNVSVSSGYPGGSSNQTDSPHSVSGKSDSLGNGSGGVDSSTRDTAYMSYRGIENLWGNAWQWCDGWNVNDQQFYVGNDSSLFADDTATGYDLLGDPASASNGYIRNVQHRTLGDIPSDTSGNSSTAFADYYYRNLGWHVARVGGSATSGSVAGPSCVLVDLSSGGRYRSVSGRLARI